MRTIFFITIIFSLFACEKKQPQSTPQADLELKSQILILNIKMGNLENKVKAQDLAFRALKVQVSGLNKQVEDTSHGSFIPVPEIKTSEKKCLEKMLANINNCKKTACSKAEGSYNSKSMLKDGSDTCVIKTEYKDKSSDLCKFPISQSSTARKLIVNILVQDAEAKTQEEIDSFVKKYCVFKK